MKTILHAKAFVLGFIIGIVFFLAVNYYHFNKMFWQLCFDCNQSFGIPFLWFESGTVFHIEQILWFGLIANILIAIAVSTILGLVFYVIAAKLFKCSPLK